MKKTSKVSISKDNKSESDENIDNLKHEFSDDWQKQMALKNEAILKSIEELIDQSLNGSDS